MKDADGEALNNVEKVLNHVGVAIRSSSGEFKSFDEVLNTVSASWNKYDGVTKGAIATAIAGQVAWICSNTYKESNYIGETPNVKTRAIPREDFI